MTVETRTQTQEALIALIEYEEAYDSAKFALEQALPNANQEVVVDLLGSLVELVMCSLKNQTLNGYENEPSSN